MTTERDSLILCVAPAEFRGPLREGFESSGFRIRFIVRPDAELSADPYSLARAAKRRGGDASAIVLVAPRRRAPSTVVEEPVVGGLPVGVVFADRPHQLGPWLASLSSARRTPPTWAMLSMWDEYYLGVAHRFRRWLRGSSPGRVSSWFATNTMREDLCRRLASGTRLAVYVGHGRARGLTGYRGVRFHHLEETPLRHPCASVVCLACDTLKRSRGVFPFGCEWVQSGRSASFFGSTASVSVRANTALAYQLGGVFSRGGVSTLGGLISQVHELCHSKRSGEGAGRALRTYRIIGNPLQPIV